MTTFCTVDEIATAIVAAARLEGEDPEAIARGASPSRARWYAAAALFDAFPDNDYRAIALGCGFLTQSTMENSRSLVRSYRRGKGRGWWDEAKIAAIRLAVTAASQEAAKSSDGCGDGPALKGQSGQAREDSQDTRPQGDLNERCGGSDNSGSNPIERMVAEPITHRPRTDREAQTSAPRRGAGVEPGPSEAVTPMAPCVLPEDVPLGKSAPAAAPILRDVDAIPAPPRSRPRSSRGDVTAAICGDPPPERSALAQKRGAA